MQIKTYTKEQLTDAIKASTSIRQVLIKLNLKEAGGNYNTIKTDIKNYNIDVSHFKGQAWSKDLKLGLKTPLEDYFNNTIKITSYKLKLKLFEYNIKQKECENCRLNSWLGKEIPLELDHIDGNKHNNTLENLRILCPNCHALTPTYRTKNIGKYSQ